VVLQIRKAATTSFPFIEMPLNRNRPRGVETYTYTSPSAKSVQLAEKIQAVLVGVGFTNRGVKKGNFHVLRETKAPAVLVEVGFLDNTGDNQLFDSKRDEIIKALVKAILSQLGISYTAPSSGSQTAPSSGQILYRVMAGSYAVRENAERQVQRLKAAGFDATIMVYETP
jgi:N-acetylmuramoyl-L-alanine amidase